MSSSTLDQNELPSITVAIPTLDRPSSLARAVRSVLDSAVSAGMRISLLIVDDGDLPKDFLNGLREATARAGCRFDYLRKDPEERGIHSSQILAIERAECDLLLFVEDDVEIDQSYLATMVEFFDKNPKVVGLGGIDTKLPRASARWSIFSKLFLMEGRGPGRLSSSGYGSTHRWKDQKKPFNSEILIGHNMAFRREKLQGIPRVWWLQGYSMGSDYYLAALARAKGQVIINPELRVAHHRDPASRPTWRTFARQQVVNHAHLLRFRGAGPARYVAFAWSVFGLWLRALLKGRVEERRGYVEGVWKAIRIRSAGAEHRSGRGTSDPSSKRRDR